MECKKTANVRKCTCSYPGCSRKGVCCECIQYHLSSRELPGCFFPPHLEKTYDRSFESFANWVLSRS
ncbi:MAG: cytosolic protein [Candidatus Aureabacteria bacterium]|nr:cytosolic protein [Candidatus Auribacterota bacterium]